MSTIRFKAGELTFEWHAAKAAANLRKHGVSFEEGATVFLDPLAQIFDDPDAVGDEHRFLMAGMSAKRRLLIVVHVERATRLRIVSARLATKRERSKLETGRP